MQFIKRKSFCKLYMAINQDKIKKALENLNTHNEDFENQWKKINQINNVLNMDNVNKTYEELKGGWGMRRRPQPMSLKRRRRRAEIDKQAYKIGTNLTAKAIKAVKNYIPGAKDVPLLDEGLNLAIGLTGGIKNTTYLSRARKRAKEAGYDPKKLSISDKKGKKLMYNHDGKKIYFGASKYGDYIIYQNKEKLKEVPKGTAEKKRKAYRARAKGKAENAEKFSPAKMSFEILW